MMLISLSVEKCKGLMPWENDRQGWGEGISSLKSANLQVKHMRASLSFKKNYKRREEKAAMTRNTPSPKPVAVGFC